MNTGMDLVSRLDMTISKNHRRLDRKQRQKVFDAIERQGFGCRRCGTRDFEVGEALEMGSIWPGEELGAYMVGLKCRECGAANGIRLQESEFLRS